MMEDSRSAEAVSQFVSRPAPGAFGYNRGRWEESGAVQCPAGRTDGLAGASCALGGAPLINERGTQEDFVRYKRFE